MKKDIVSTSQSDAELNKYLAELAKSDDLLKERTDVAVDSIDFQISKEQFDTFADRIIEVGDRIGASVSGVLDSLRILGRKYSEQRRDEFESKNKTE